LIDSLYELDFGKCYLATQTILTEYPDVAGAALVENYRVRGYNDYGAHYHIIKVWGWLKYAPAYDLLIEALNNPEPQFQKSRAAAAIALAEIGDDRAVDAITGTLTARNWDLRYAALMALAKFDRHSTLPDDSDWLVRELKTAS
jgi:bilin biosynthesis protein